MVTVYVLPPSTTDCVDGDRKVFFSRALTEEKVPVSLPSQFRVACSPEAVSVSSSVSLYWPPVFTWSGLLAEAELKTLTLVATTSEVPAAFLLGSLVRPMPPVPGASAGIDTGVRDQS